MVAIRWLPPLFLGMLHPAVAYAAGGAHVIDDSAVETPGTCHFENWLTRSDGALWSGSIAPACTSLAQPNLEIGGALAHARNSVSHDTTLGLAPKLAIGDEKRGVGLALDASAGFSLERGRIDAASLIVPATVARGAWRFSLNGGWVWTRTGIGHSLFAGAQTEWQATPRIGLMLEGFGRNRGKLGFQTGLRWTSRDGTVDVDCLGGRYLDGQTPTSITIGLTIRR